MKKLLFIMLLFMISFSLMANNIEQYTGEQWEKLEIIDPLSKLTIINGVLVGISITHDYIFDINEGMTEHYRAYSAFIAQENVAVNILNTLNRYYKENRDNFKYNDRVVTMILVIYGKYWWNISE